MPYKPRCAIQNPSHLADALASQLRISVEDKQGLLELFSSQARLQRLIELLELEIEKRQLDRSIQTRVKRQMEKAQKEYYLNEQIKAIHKELGRKDEKAELEDLKKKIEEVGMTEEAKAEGDAGTASSGGHAADVRRRHCFAHLYRLAGQCALETEEQRDQGSGQSRRSP